MATKKTKTAIKPKPSPKSLAAVKPKSKPKPTLSKLALTPADTTEAWDPSKARLLLDRLRPRWSTLTPSEIADFDSLSTDAQRSALGARTKARAVAAPAGPPRLIASSASMPSSASTTTLRALPTTSFASTPWFRPWESKAIAPPPRAQPGPLPEQPSKAPGLPATSSSSPWSATLEGAAPSSTSSLTRAVRSSAMTPSSIPSRPSSRSLPAG